MKRQLSKHCCLLSAVLLFLASSVQGKFDFNLNCQHAMQAILDLRFMDARMMIEHERTAHPSNGYAIYLEHYAESIELIITEEQALYEKLIDQHEERMKQMHLLDDGAPDNSWLQAEMLFHTGLAQVKFGTRVNGVSKLFSSYKKVREHRKKHPQFWQNQKLAGVYNIMLDNIPPFIRWAADIFGYGGDSEIGIYQLKEYSDKAKFVPGLAEEAVLITNLGYKMTGEEAEGFIFLSASGKDILDNTLVKYLYASTAAFNYRNDLALQLLSEIHEHELQVNFYGLDYLTGRCKLNHLEADAREYLECFLEHYPGLDYKKDVCNRLSYYYLIRGDMDKFEEYRAEVAVVGQDLRDRDQEAILESRAGIVPHVGLLKSRLLCDGGYLDEAMDIMKSIDPEKLEMPYEMLEYHYRLGRILQLSGSIEDAMSELRKAYEKGQAEPYTYATRAALQLGRIYEEKKEYKLAYDWYDRCTETYSSGHTTEGVKMAALKGAKRQKGKF